jgi:CxxC-x17-CxxC domain-containing protein
MRKDGSPSTALEVNRETGSWGEFFPPSLSPFAYNETTAHEYIPLSKEEAIRQCYQWKEREETVPDVEKVIPAEQLPESIDDIPDDVLNWAIRCVVTGRPFKPVKQELLFYRRMRLPFPRLHPDERHKRRNTIRSQWKLWDRTCAKCGKEIQTTYSPDRSEVVYCEECYLHTVY